MRTSDADILIVPGLFGSEPGHWQSRWEQKLRTARRVHQSDWHNPQRESWTGAVSDAVAAAERPVILIAHSLGVHAIAHAAGAFEPGRVVGGFLVAPPSEEVLRSFDRRNTGFEVAPRGPLPFPSLLVASRNDPYGSYEASEDLAFAWGSALVDAGEAGHINVESGHGPWPEGLMSLAAFLSKL
ncbi:MAG: alpha/beta hydrolase [Beijerinckiaceae bacterium]|nr:alpha/beta hydrolase [Beijerinckiaceae bacterium]MDO9441387.1 alpha/beta hydrolase [Beijerinckiaceae bacterium]